jgi:ABC-2 type transport system ATP-binding protein
VGDPELLFLDEPTTGLDPQSRRQVWDIVNSFKQRGRTVLLTTHYMDEAERLSDRVAVVDHGKIIALDTPRELIRTLGGDHVVEISVATDDRAALAPTELQDLPSVRSVHTEAGALLLTVGEPHVAIPALLERLQALGRKLASLTTRTASLEDVFVSLTGRHLRDA